MSKALTITAKLPKNEAKGRAEDKIGTLTIQAPETIEEAIQMYGGEAVLTNAMANFTVKLQGNVRSALEKGESAEAMQTRLGPSKMGVAVSKAAVSTRDAALAYFATLSPEGKKAYVQELRAEAAKAA